MSYTEPTVAWSLSDPTPDSITVQIDSAVVAQTIEDVARVMFECTPSTMGHMEIAHVVAKMAREAIPTGIATAWTRQRVRLLETGCRGLAGIAQKHPAEFASEFGFDPSRLGDVSSLLTLAVAMIEYERRMTEVQA